MAKVYIHLSGEDVDRKMLEKVGLFDNEVEKTPDPLATKECPRCREKNSPASMFCVKCPLPLDGEERARLAREQEALQSRLPALLDLLDDPTVLQALQPRLKCGDQDDRTEFTRSMNLSYRPEN